MKKIDYQEYHYGHQIESKPVFLEFLHLMEKFLNCIKVSDDSLLSTRKNQISQQTILALQDLLSPCMPTVKLVSLDVDTLS